MEFDHVNVREGKVESMMSRPQPLESLWDGDVRPTFR